MDLMLQARPESSSWPTGRSASGSALGMVVRPHGCGLTQRVSDLLRMNPLMRLTLPQMRDRMPPGTELKELAAAVKKLADTQRVTKRLVDNPSAGRKGYRRQVYEYQWRW